MNEAIEDARRYFNSLWQREAPAWRAGQITPYRMRDGVCVPFDLGLTTIARVADQIERPAALAETVERLAKIGPEQFAYGPDQHHITLVGFVPRFADPAEAAAERIERLRQAAAMALADAPPAVFDLIGFGVLGAQVFVQVVPRDGTWPRLRERMVGALARVGEASRGFPSMAPIHMNVMRVTDARPSALAALFARIETLRQTPLGTLAVDNVSLVMTDFVVTPRHTRRLAAFPLSAPTARSESR